MKEHSIQTALISVTDKSKLVDLAAVLKEKNVKILASSGTKKFLEKNGFAAEEIAEFTGSPEILGGRVKTLHPKIHAGILADRDNPEHMSSMSDSDNPTIDLVVVNLYPFKEKFLSGSLSERELCEFIDIGGITLIRAAAKNFHHVSIATSPEQYDTIIGEIRANGNTSLDTRKTLALDAFTRTSSYDIVIQGFLSQVTGGETLPDVLNLTFEKKSLLRYGENPHQKAALYLAPDDSFFSSFIQHQGKELSFNNYLDITGAFALARDLGPGNVAINKHTTPCGVGWCGDTLASFERALKCDKISAFGGIIAINGGVNVEAARAMTQFFTEVILARSFDEEALAHFSKKKNLRVVTIPDACWESNPGNTIALYAGGALLLQELDIGFPELDEMKIVTKRKPSDEELLALQMVWKVTKHVKSNAIVISDHQGTVGIGAGQMSRVDSSRIAVNKATEAGFSLTGTVAGSDAFFPFPDGVTELAHSGIKAVIQPGGSIRDQEVIDAADAAGVAMIFTGRRHFRHL